MKITNALTMMHKYFPKETKQLSEMIHDSEKNYLRTKIFSKHFTYTIEIRKAENEASIHANEHGFEPDKIQNKIVDFEFLKKHESI